MCILNSSIFIWLASVRAFASSNAFEPILQHSGLPWHSNKKQKSKAAYVSSVMNYAPHIARTWHIALTSVENHKSFVITVGKLWNRYDAERYEQQKKHSCISYSTCICERTADEVSQSKCSRKRSRSSSLFYNPTFVWLCETELFSFALLSLAAARRLLTSTRMYLVHSKK